LTVNRTSAETLDEAVNQQVGKKMRPNAAAAKGQMAETSAQKFLPTEQPTDAYWSRKDGFNKKKNYASWSTTYKPSSSSKTAEASRQTPKQKEEKERREKIYAILKSEFQLSFEEKLKTLANKQVAFNNFVKTSGTSEPEDVTEHLQPVKIHPASTEVQRENWHFAGQTDWVNQ
jgi:hypothetical protein